MCYGSILILWTRWEDELNAFQVYIDGLANQ